MNDRGVVTLLLPPKAKMPTTDHTNLWNKK